MSSNGAADNLLVVNFKAYKSVARLDEVFGAANWHYVGRANRWYGLPASPLANPFRVEDHGRGQAIEQYRRWLWGKLKAGDQAVMGALRAIKAGDALACWCSPAGCHADVIKAAWAYLREHDRQPACRVIVVGSRTFNDYALLAATLDRLLAGHEDIQILSGAARGADRLGERYAAERGLPVKRMPAEWERYGRRAGYIRNEAVAAEATHAVVFWDGASPGSRHLIEVATAKGIPVDVIRF